MRPWTWNLVVAGGGALLALAALAFLHGEARVLQAVVAGAVGAGLRWGVGPSWSGLPGYLSLPLDLGIASVGALITVLATLGLSRPEYALLRVREALALAAATAMLGTLVVSAVYSHKRLAAEIGAHEVRLAALRERSLHARLGALQSQINPHFLFNTLNTLAEVVHEDPDMAEDLIGDLAAMMRYALHSSTGEVALAEELDTVRRYLRLEEARLGDRLRARVEEDPAAGATRVPGLLVQPLVENAVRHAAAARPEGGSVRVTARAVDGATIIEVEDDGPGLPAEVVDRIAAGRSAPGPGTGGAGGDLMSVAERLALTWPDGAATLEVDAAREGGALLRLRVPR